MRQLGQIQIELRLAFNFCPQRLSCQAKRAACGQLGKDHIETVGCRPALPHCRAYLIGELAFQRRQIDCTGSLRFSRRIRFLGHTHQSCPQRLEGRGIARIREPIVVARGVSGHAPEELRMHLRQRLSLREALHRGHGQRAGSKLLYEESGAFAFRLGPCQLYCLAQHHRSFRGDQLRRLLFCLRGLQRIGRGSGSFLRHARTDHPGAVLLLHQGAHIQRNELLTLLVRLDQSQIEVDRLGNFQRGRDELRHIDQLDLSTLDRKDARLRILLDITLELIPGSQAKRRRLQTCGQSPGHERRYLPALHRFIHFEILFERNFFKQHLSPERGFLIDTAQLLVLLGFQPARVDLIERHSLFAGDLQAEDEGLRLREFLPLGGDIFRGDRSRVRKLLLLRDHAPHFVIAEIKLQHLALLVELLQAGFSLRLLLLPDLLLHRLLAYAEHVELHAAPPGAAVDAETSQRTVIFLFCLCLLELNCQCLSIPNPGRLKRHIQLGLQQLQRKCRDLLIFGSRLFRNSIVAGRKGRYEYRRRSGKHIALRRQNRCDSLHLGSGKGCFRKNRSIGIGKLPDLTAAGTRLPRRIS